MVRRLSIVLRALASRIGLPEGLGIPKSLGLPKSLVRGLWPIALVVGAASTASATDHIYFSATDNVTDVLVSYINAETVRLDVSTWYLSEHSISIAIANRFLAGLPVRIIGDRAAPFENDPHTKTELYWLANQGVPIRLRFNPTWFPEIDHWKAAIFVGQNTVEFGSGNFAPTELRPVSPTNYCDETELFTGDPAIVNAFKTKFDVMWNDTTREPESVFSGPPYLKDWNDACAHEPTGRCADYYTLYPTPAPMVINTARLEPDNPTPPDLIWGQGPDFNNRLTQEINAENSRIDLVVYRLEVDNITNALLNRFRAGVPVRVIVDPEQYANIAWPEFWLTHANIDKLWAAGVPVQQRLHAGVTHMKTLVTSTYASNASSNFSISWQRDHDYFVSAATKPAIYQAIADRVQTMWSDTVGFGPFQPTPPNAAALASPASGATGVATSGSLIWNIAQWAVSYDVYLGTSPSSLALVGNTPALMVQNPPALYSWTPTTPLAGGTTYYWRVVSRTNATPVNPSMISTSATWSFTTASGPQPPPPPGAPSPAAGSSGIRQAPTLTWSAPGATSYALSFGTSNPPPLVAPSLTTASYSPGTLAADTVYFWQVTAINAVGSTPGPVWSFMTDSPASKPPYVVLQATDGSVGIWYLGGAQGNQVQGFAQISGPMSGWSVVDLADLNRDGVPDVILRYTDGSLGVWYMGGPQGNQVQGFAFISGPLQGWVPVAIADLNGDGHPDLLLQFTDGSVGVWYLGGPQGNQVQSFAPISGPLQGWAVAGAADLNGDGHPDLVLRHGDGSVGVWYLGGVQGTQVQSFAAVSGPTVWSVEGVVDLNGDGHPDVILRYTDGSLGVWYMGGAQGNLVQSFAFISGPVSGWRGLMAH